MVGPLLIDLEKIRIMDNGKPVLAVERAAMGLSGRQLVQGKIRPNRLMVVRPEIKFNRSKLHTDCQRSLVQFLQYTHHIKNGQAFWKLRHCLFLASSII